MTWVSGISIRPNTNSCRPRNTIHSLSRRKPWRQKKCTHDRFFGPVGPSPPPPRVKRNSERCGCFPTNKTITEAAVATGPSISRQGSGDFRAQPSKIRPFRTSTGFFSGFDRLQTYCRKSGPASILYFICKRRLICSSL